METKRGVEGLLDKIRPPRIEDAGLEDCALSPDSIKEAFLKAATAVGSRAVSKFSTSEDEEGRCVDDPWPDVGEDSVDTLVGIREYVEPPPGACVAGEGDGLPELMGDEADAGLTGAEEREDKAMDGKDVEEGGETCVDGLKGLNIGEKENEEEEGGGRPILGETSI